MNEESIQVNPVMIKVSVSKMLPGQIGLFAVRAIQKDTIIAEADKLGEKFIPWSEYNKIDEITRGKITDYCLTTAEGFFVPDDFNYLSVPWNMNHCCSPNVGFDEKGNFVTNKSVEGEEELTWDYGMGMSNPKFQLLCSCGSSNCRKVITGNDWKDENFREKNKKYFLRELLVKI